MGGRLRRIVHAYYVTMAIRTYIFDSATLCIVHVDYLPGDMPDADKKSRAHLG